MNSNTFSDNIDQEGDPQVNGANNVLKIITWVIILSITVLLWAGVINVLIN